VTCPGVVIGARGDGCAGFVGPVCWGGVAKEGLMVSMDWFDAHWTDVGVSG